MASVFISTGEHSGDMHAAALCAQLVAEGIVVYAIGNRRLEQAGAIILDDLADKSSIGFLEVFTHIRDMWQAYRGIKKRLLQLKPDLILAVDFQGFNVPLLKWAKQNGLRTSYYICPQEWQWGSRKNGAKIAAVTDRMITIFKEAADFYNELGGTATFVGHPLLDMCPPQPSQERDVLAVYTGSRTQEHKHLIPLFIQAVQAIQNEREISVVFSAVNDAHKERLKAQFPKGVHWQIRQDDERQLMKDAVVALTASGTITLELALSNVPFVAAYRFNPISYWVIKHTIGKRFMSRVRYIALPNIIMKREISPEFLQEKATVGHLANAVLANLEGASRDRILDDFKRLRLTLGEPGAIGRASQVLLDELKGHAS